MTIIITSWTPCITMNFAPKSFTHCRCTFVKKGLHQDKGGFLIPEVCSNVTRTLWFTELIPLMKFV